MKKCRRKSIGSTCPTSVGKNMLNCTSQQLPAVHAHRHQQAVAFRSKPNQSESSEQDTEVADHAVEDRTKGAG